MASDARQVEQRGRRKEWEKEGHYEWPQQITTMLQRHQMRRFSWLSKESKGTILELGCNWGFVLGYLNGDTGIDISQECIDMARVLNKKAVFIQADITKLDSAKYELTHDTIIIPDVLEHVPWEDVHRVLYFAIDNARQRVLVTIPDGREDTTESTNLKHQWLCDDAHIEMLNHMLGVEPTMDGTFLYWEVEK